MKACSFEPSLALDSIRGAKYNPRSISEEAFGVLCQSVRDLGIVKPILVNRQNNIIIAGHQRTKAMKATGLTATPAMLLAGVTVAEEMRFNQIHNSSDQNFHDVPLQIRGVELKHGYQWVDSRHLAMNVQPGAVNGACERNSIFSMIYKFGNWGSAVANLRGDILISKQYAICAKVLKIPLLVYVMQAEKVPPLLHYFKLDYGEYNYAGKADKTFNQSFCQFQRLSDKSENSKKTSPLYVNHILPHIKRGMRILDFGAGRKEYAKMCRGMGHDVVAVEFFEKMQGGVFNMRALDREVRTLGERIRKGDLFDLVLADVVLSSCNTQQAEDDVLHCLNYFCKIGGYVCLSGRRMEMLEGRKRAKRLTCNGQQRRFVEFLDKDNISAIYRQGKWTFQKFHWKSQLEDIARKYITRDGKVRHTTFASGWQLMGQKTHSVSTEAICDALQREFNLPLPNNRRVNKHEYMIECVREYAATRHV